MKVDCAHKLPGRPLWGTTDCEASLFRQQARKTQFTNIFFIISSQNFMNF